MPSSPVNTPGTSGAIRDRTSGDDAAGGANSPVICGHLVNLEDLTSSFASTTSLASPSDSAPTRAAASVPAVPAPLLLHVSPGQRGSGFMVSAELVARFPLPPAALFALLTHPDKSGAFRNVLAVEDRVVVNEEKQREEQQGSLGSAIQPEGDSNSSSTPASSEGPKASPSTPCATEGGQGGSSGAHGRLLVVEETQVGEMHMLWHHTTFRSRVRLEEDGRDPERLVQRFSLLHGDNLERFEGSWTVTALHQQQLGREQVGSTSVLAGRALSHGGSSGTAAAGVGGRASSGEAAADAAVAGANVGDALPAWCEVTLTQGLTPKGIPALVRGMVGGMVRGATEGAVRRLHEDLAALAAQVLSGASVEQAIKAVREAHAKSSHHHAQHGHQHKAKPAHPPSGSAACRSAPASTPPATALVPAAAATAGPSPEAQGVVTQEPSGPQGAIAAAAAAAASRSESLSDASEWCLVGQRGQEGQEGLAASVMVDKRQGTAAVLPAVEVPVASPYSANAAVAAAGAATPPLVQNALTGEVVHTWLP